MGEDQTFVRRTLGTSQNQTYVILQHHTRHGYSRVDSKHIVRGRGVFYKTPQPGQRETWDTFMFFTE